MTEERKAKALETIAMVLMKQMAGIGLTADDIRDQLDPNYLSKGEKDLIRGGSHELKDKRVKRVGSA